MTKQTPERCRLARSRADRVLGRGWPEFVGGLPAAEARAVLTPLQARTIWLYDAGMSANAIAASEQVCAASVRRRIGRAEYRLEVARLAAGLPLLEAAA